MAEELIRRFAAQGIELPEVRRIPVAGTGTAWAFSATGEAVAGWRRRLRGVSGPTGYWPVLAGDAGLDVRSGGAESGGHALARAAGLDGAALVNPGGRKLAGQGPDAIVAYLKQWPEDPDDVVRLDRFTLPYQDRNAVVALVPASAGWQVPALLGFGGWNNCPEPAVHAAVLRYWGDRFGAELACVTGDGLELAVARPPRTRIDALEFAWEYASYCVDSVDGLYQADNLAELAASLIDAEVVRLWWD